MAAGAEAVDDDLSRQRDIEVGCRDGGGVEIVKHLRCLVIASVKKFYYVTTTSRIPGLIKKIYLVNKKNSVPISAGGEGSMSR